MSTNKRLGCVLKFSFDSNNGRAIGNRLRGMVPPGMPGMPPGMPPPGMPGGVAKNMGVKDGTKNPNLYSDIDMNDLN